MESQPPVTSLYQSEKPHRQVNEKQSVDGIDYRFRDYGNALKAGDAETCERLRQEWAHEDCIITKFNTTERLWIAQMGTYAREIQILRHEIRGYKKIISGHNQLGDKMLEQAAEARVEHPEVYIDIGF